VSGAWPPIGAGLARAVRLRSGSLVGSGQPPAATQAPAPLVALAGGGPSPDRGRVGAKAASIAWLAGRGVPVPPAVAVPADVVARIAAGESLAIEGLALALGRWLDPGRTYAVRPSPDTGEDTRARPGQPGTRLAVHAGDVAEAILAVVGPAVAPPAVAPPAVEPPAIEPSAASGIPAGPLPPPPTGVVVQQMVRPGWTGVAFSRNPLTGLDEVVIEGVAGRGDPAQQDGTAPERWVFRWGSFAEEPAVPLLPATVVEEVARETARLARARGGPVELTWAHDGSTTWWLQARPMVDVDGLRVYSNRIARDMLPGVIKPLVWSVNTSVVNAAWIDLLEEILGPLDLRPGDLTRSFGYRAYFDMTAFGSIFETLGLPRDSLELLLGLPRGPETPRMRLRRSTLRHLPRMLATARRTLSRGRWTRAALTAMQRRYEELAVVDLAQLDEAALLRRVDDISALARRAAHANIVIPMVLLAYERTLWLQVRAAGVDPAAVDPAAARADRARWDPNAALDRLRELVDALPAEARASLASRSSADLGEAAPGPLRGPLDTFVTRFGHLSESNNDFSRPSWREDRSAILALVLARPSRRRVAWVEPRAVEARLAPWRRPAFRLLWRRSGAFRVYRDAVGATWSKSYGLFRGTFLALGSRLVARELLDRPDDVFYLTLEEVRALAMDHVAGSDVRAVVSRRRVEVAEAADLIVPEIVFGDAFVPRRRNGEVQATLAGIPASRGVVRGPARVVRSSADFARVDTGDIIIIPFSDVAWSPLFALAAGAVAEEASGILSHAAIVAREYGIPCVVGVSDACELIPDGMPIVVDGTAGRVMVDVAEVR
jgi:phosphohistidine swiveling domain-containing protein